MNQKVYKTIEVVTKHNKIYLETDLTEIPKSAVEEILNHMKDEFERNALDIVKDKVFEKQIFKENSMLHKRYKTWRTIAFINAILCCLVAILSIFN